jgi:hypothetical protein
MNDDLTGLSTELTTLDPEDFEECNPHELHRFSLALAYAHSVLCQAMEDFQRRAAQRAADAGTAKPIDARLQ